MINIDISNKLRLKRAQLSIAVTLVLAYSSGTLGANCVFISSSHFTANFGNSPINVTVPKDAPIGTIVYQESILGPSKGFQCNTTAPFIFSLNPTFGSVTSGTSFPLGKTGLSLRVNYEDYGYLSADRTLLSRYYVDPAETTELKLLNPVSSPRKT